MEVVIQTVRDLERAQIHSAVKHNQTDNQQYLTSHILGRWPVGNDVISFYSTEDSFVALLVNF